MIKRLLDMIAASPRWLRIPAAYLAASVASGFAIVVGLALSQAVQLLLQGLWSEALLELKAVSYLLPLGLLPLGLLSAGFVAIHAFVPAAVVIAIAEKFRLRSAAFYGCTAAITAIIFWASFIGNGRLFRTVTLAFSLAPDRIFNTTMVVLITGAAGFVGGLTYWRMAGRSAGGGPPATT